MSPTAKKTPQKAKRRQIKKKKKKLQRDRDQHLEGISTLYSPGGDL